MPAFTQVVVLDNSGNKYCNNATGTIDHNQFFTTVRVPLSRSASGDEQYFINGNEQGVGWRDFPKMYYVNGEFVDNPQ